MHGPGRLSVDAFPAPDPEPGAIVLRMQFSGICGTDKHTWRGESLQYAGTDHERGVPYPVICGHENVGVIEAIGPGPAPTDDQGRELRVGDRVVPAPNLTCGRCRFCLAEDAPYYLCTALQDYGNSLSCADPPHLFGGWSQLMYLLPGTRLFRVPEGLPSELAALTEIMAVTHGLDAAQSMTGLGGGFRAGYSVAVVGIGPLGLLHLAKAEMLGAGSLIAIDTMPGRLEHAAAFGAELCLDASRTTHAERREAVRDLTGGLGADVVCDCSGVSATFTEALELLRPGGTLIEAGAFVDTGTVELDPNRHICTPGTTVIGIGGERLAAYAPSLALLDRHQHRLPFRRAITHRVGLDEVEHSLELAQTDAAMKILVAPNGV